MRIDILTLMPEMFDGPFGCGVLGRAIDSGVAEVVVTNIRDFATDNYRKVDDNPYGGGPGMVMMCQPIFDAVGHVLGSEDGGAAEVEIAAAKTGKVGTENAGQNNEVVAEAKKPPVIMMTPQGRPFDQALAAELAQMPRFVMLAGRYEGFDERIRTGLVDMEISLGDFVLSGGEIAAMAITDAVIRLLPGALGCGESIESESFSQGLLEYPQYTRPREYKGMSVPDVLLGGNHAEIEAWRLVQSQLRTQQRRPDLWDEYVNKNK